VGYRITLENLAAIALTAGRSDVASYFNDDLPRFSFFSGAAPEVERPKPVLPNDAELAILLRSASITFRWRHSGHRARSGPHDKKLTPYQQRQDTLTDWIEGYVEPKDAPARTRRSTYVQREEILERLLTRWAARQGSPKRITARLEVAMEYGLEDAKLPIIEQLLRRGESFGADAVSRAIDVEPSTEFAIVMLGRLGKKQHARLLAPYLDNHRGLRLQSLHLPYVNFSPELRDLVLASVVQLPDIAQGISAEDGCQRPRMPCETAYAQTASGATGCHDAWH
jgi:hypothetical protein